MQNKSKSELCEQDNQIAEEYWDELCDAVGKVCANPTDDNFQKMEGLKNKITKFYQAHNKKMEAFDDFEDDREIIEQLKLKVSQQEIEKEISDQDIITMLEENIGFNKALLETKALGFNDVVNNDLVEKHIKADEKRLAALKDFMEEGGTKKHFIEPEIPPFEPYIKS